MGQIQKIDFQIDLPLLLSESEEFVRRRGWPDKKPRQWSFTHTAKCPPEHRWMEGVGSLYEESLDKFRASERDFSQFNEELKGSYFHWIYENVPFKPARMRLMCLLPKTCLSLHEDTGPRYHFAIKTHSSAFMIFPNTQEVTHIPADSFLYRMNAEASHTAMNADISQERWHLVFSDLDNC